MSRYQQLMEDLREAGKAHDQAVQNIDPYHALARVDNLELSTAQLAWIVMQLLKELARRDEIAEVLGKE